MPIFYFTYYIFMDYFASFEVDKLSFLNFSECGHIFDGEIVTKIVSRKSFLLNRFPPVPLMDTCPTRLTIA